MQILVILKVAPRRGAWIETLVFVLPALPYPVAPRRGAWIETSITVLRGADSSDVAPRRGAWIETSWSV